MKFLNTPTLGAPKIGMPLDGGASIGYVQSRGTDLVTNGTGALGTNYNFSGFTFVGSDAPTGANGSFLINFANAGPAFADELLPFDPGKHYKLSFQMRQTLAGAVSAAYGMISPYAADGKIINPQNYMYIAGTTTTLAADLVPGATTITLTSSANWYGTTGKPAATATWNRSIIWWDYTDALGKAWPVETYSQNWAGYDYWADGGITGNVITLRVPYVGPTRLAGTKMSNASAGGTYIYMPSLQNTVVPVTWTSYSDVFSAGIMTTGAPNSGRGGSAWTSGMPPGTAQIKIGWLLNYAPTTGKHAIALVSFSDASAAADAASAALVKASNLSDLASVVTARTNLGLGTAATTAATAYATAAQGTVRVNNLTERNALTQSPGLTALQLDQNVLHQSDGTTWFPIGAAAVRNSYASALVGPSGNFNNTAWAQWTIADFLITPTRDGWATVSLDVDANTVTSGWSLAFLDLRLNGVSINGNGHSLMFENPPRVAVTVTCVQQVLLRQGDSAALTVWVATYSSSGFWKFNSVQWRVSQS